MATTSTTRRGSAGGGGEKSRLRGAHGSGEERRSLRQRTPVRRAANVRCMNSASVRLLLQCRGRCLRETVRERERENSGSRRIVGIMYIERSSLSLPLASGRGPGSLVHFLALAMCLRNLYRIPSPSTPHALSQRNQGRRERAGGSVCVCVCS